MIHVEEKAKILVVEDEADIQQVLCVFLRFSGFEVCGASNGEEAMKAIVEFVPHLIVLDLMMQPISGWEVLSWLRAQQLTPPIPVLIMSALTQLPKQIQGFEEGAIEYTLKPTQPNVLVERIRAILLLDDDQRLSLRSAKMHEKQFVLERLSTPLPDEFVY